MASDKNYARRRRSCAQVNENLHSGHPLHPDVQNDNQNRILRQISKKKFRVAECVDFITGGLEQAANGLQNRRIIVNKADDFSQGSDNTTRFEFFLGPGVRAGIKQPPTTADT